ncbi:MAG TPA: glutaredoxin 3 [Caulobacterales bacterium]|jgi:glutaredoxin 3|nr:glutaredoxin 3 [Caulobacterales bacterium]
MQPVTIYTKPYCPFCLRAIDILRRKGAEITEISAAFVPEKKAEMLARSNGKRTYPQIFIGDTHVGGCDDLMALDARGGLDPLLQGA